MAAGEETRGAVSRGRVTGNRTPQIKEVRSGAGDDAKDVRDDAVVDRNAAGGVSELAFTDSRSDGELLILIF